MIKIILAATALIAAPAIAQTTGSEQLGNSMGRDAQAAPHSVAGDHASGAAHTPTHKAMHRTRSMHSKSSTSAMSGNAESSDTTSPR